MVQKLETPTELKSSVEQFLKLWKSEAHQVPKHSPSNVHAVHLHEGDWITSGSIKLWKYTIDGRTEEFKEKIIVDEENKKVSVIGVDGDVLKLYKPYNVLWELAPKENGSSAKVIIEYEKLNESFEAPNKYMELVLRITKDIDDGIIKASK